MVNGIFAVVVQDLQLHQLLQQLLHQLLQQLHQLLLHLPVVAHPHVNSQPHLLDVIVQVILIVALRQVLILVV